jgi:hypothetical protein
VVCSGMILKVFGFVAFFAGKIKNQNINLEKTRLVGLFL